PLGKRWQDPIGAFHKRNPNILGRIDLIETIGDDCPCSLVQLRRKLRAGGAGTDDRHMELAWLDGPLLRMRTKARIDYLSIEPRRVFRSLEHDGMLSDARRAEIVRHTAHRDDKRIVGKGSLRCDLLALV